ncbi:hypothetical protein NELON_10645 [Neisseria elongata subsp. glycolytica ATCC 29315]|uniref:Translocation and assembly module TamB C-terminal domain-containing protein n=2 Tax=Neisseria elongata subsp. glycolytica ATCC 29315 TaxID=546263 RepID=A0A0B5CSM8_NEIEG|nr:translocation/assembly module TamB domain-containing protein [Neisseria elongata]AJE19316.1 hypothetical protein NELON_10645 [Neisseria elongata subsp. glycolytica ATCC 29315]SQH49086.1 Periplasmic protein [Neisseria elongata subsp. glycolytica]
MTAQEDMKRPSENGAPDNKRPSEKTRTGKSPARRLLKTVLWSSVLLSASSAGFLYWLAATESGLRFGLYTLPELGGVKISSKTLKGTLWHGFSGEDWRIETPSADLTVSSLGLQWQPQELFSDGLLHIRHLSVGDLHITAKPTPPKEERPAALPESISLPLAVKLDKLSVGKISSGKAGNTFLLHAEAAYDYDHKRHKLTLNSLQTPWSSTGGELEIQTASPFALQGSIRGGAELEGITGGGEILLSGDLRRTAFKADLVGGKVSLKAEGLVGPFENSLDEQIDHILIKGHALNLAEFVPSAPQTDLDFDATIVPSPQKGLALEGSIDLTNSLAAPADQNGIPVRSILGEFTVGDSGILKVHDVTATLLEEGALILGGETDTDKNTFALEAILKNASLSDFVSQKYDDVFEGSLLLNGTYREPQAKWDIRGNRASSTGELAIANDTTNGQRSLNIIKASLLPKDGGELDIKGKLELFNDRLLEAEVSSKNFNPGKLHSDFPVGSINGDIKLNGVLAEEKFSGKMQFGNSVLSGAVLSGNADVLYEKQHLARAAADIRLGRNRVKTDGSFGKAGDRLNLDINAPELDKFGFGLGGALTAKGFLAGEPKSISADLSGSVRNLRVKQAVNIRELDFKAAASPDYSRPLNLQINGRELVIPGSSGESTRIDTVNAAVSGTGMRHSIRSSGSMEMGGKNYKLDLEADGGLNKENQWKGTVGRLDLSGGFNLKLQNRMSLEAGAERVALGAAQWSAMGGRLNLNSFVWDKKNGLTSKGTAANLNVAELESFFKMPVEHNLVLSADWDLAYSQNARGFLNVRQHSGDIVLPYRKQALGLNGLTLQTRFQNGRIDNQINGKTRYGNIVGNVGISQQFGNSIMQAPISGNLKIDIPDLAALKNLMPVGQSISGTLNADTIISGRVGEPQLRGNLNGDNLYYVNRDLGVILDNGSLRSRLNGQQWQIQSLLFKRGNGNINLSGTVGWGGGVPAVDVDAVLDKYGILDKPRRRLTASGNTHFRYSYKNGIILDGSLKVDEGNFGFQKSGMPELDDDVVVLGEPKKETRDSVPFSMDIDLDLNDKVFFRGEGVDVTLGGRLKLTAQPKQDIQAVGTVAVVKGKYKAYGQDLNITKGTVSFVGPLSRPNLNIRAVRNLSPVGAGVEVLGNLENPRVTLVANEPMSEKDKLSWLILNRASSGSDGDEAALTAAASAFLAGKINDRIGLVDDFGLTSKRSRNAQTGELNPAEQVLTVGKQLSSELYLGYEFGLTSASQTVKLVYQLTRTIQAIVRVGSQSSGGEIKYVIRFD